MNMNMKEWKKETFLLTNENVNVVTDRINSELQDYGATEDCLRLRLAFEDILGIWQRALGKEATCTVQYGKQFGRWRVQLAVSGAVLDPSTDSSATDMEIAGNAILQGLGLSPSFEYKNGVNYVTLSLPKKKPNQVFYLAGSAFTAVILGLLSTKAPSDVQSFFVDLLATPILDMLLGILSGVAMPLIFLSICISIINMGNISTLGRIGKKFILTFMAVAFAAPFLPVLFYLFTATISTGSTGTGGFQEIFSMIINVVPKNILSPFVDGNALQIIFLGACSGVALLILIDKTKLLADCIKQLLSVANIFMAGVNRLLPFFVFFTFYKLTASGSIAMFSSSLTIIIMVIVALLLWGACATAYFCWRMQVPARVLIKKTLPSFLVSLSTASSMASYSMRIECSQKELGLDEQIANFAFPLAQALLKPELAICFAISAICIGTAYGVTITPMWLFICGLISALLSIATPPVAGAGQMAYAMLFMQLGLPTEGMLLAIAAAALLDFFMTPMTCYLQQLLIVLNADQLHKVDKDVLRSATPAQI